MQKPVISVASLLFTFFVAVVSSLTARASSLEGSEIDKGYYLSRAAGCADCHTTNLNEPYAGGYAIDVPGLGKFFSPNITPDPETGIGNWTEDDFQRALRKGVDPHGRYLYPVFPFRSYAKMTNEDVHAIYTFLKSVAPVQRRPPDHEFDWFVFEWRPLLLGWRELYFPGASWLPKLSWFGASPSSGDPEEDRALRAIKIGSKPFKVDSRHSPEWNRGAYLVEGFAHCTECHTPRTQGTHGLILSKWMGGTTDSLKLLIPNITPDAQTGLGSWTKTDWVRFLESGFTREGTSVGVEMAEVVKNMSSLTYADRASMAEYLLSIRPVKSHLAMVEDYKHPRLEDLLLHIEDTDYKAIPSDMLNAKVQECAQCHNSVSSGGQIAGQNEGYLQMQLKAFLHQSRVDITGNMNPVAERLDSTYNNLNWINIVAHYFSIQPHVPSPEPLTWQDRNLANRGRTLATVMCISCHMNPENGGKPINDLVPVLAGQSRHFLKRRLFDFQSPAGARSPVMFEMAKSLTESDITNLAIYFESQ